MAATMAAAAEHEATADADYTEHLDSAREAGGDCPPSATPEASSLGMSVEDSRVLSTGVCVI